MATLVFAGIFLAALGLFWPGARRSYERERQRAIQEGADQIQAEMSTLYGGEHEYRVIDAHDFPHLDRGFYDGEAARLEAQGFHRLADLEDLTLSRAHPNLRTFIRVMVDDGGLIRAGIFHMRPMGVMVKLLQLTGLVPRHIKVIELVTEVPHGRFVTTTPTEGLDHLSMPPELRIERHPPRTSTTVLLDHHRRRLKQLVAREPHLVPVALSSPADVIASMQRSNVVIARHRKKLGGLTREELERMARRPLSRTDEEVLAEVRRRQASPEAKREE